MLTNYNGGALKKCLKLQQVMNHESMRMNWNLTSRRPYDKPNPTNFLEERKKVNSEWYITIC